MVLRVNPLCLLVRKLQKRAITCPACGAAMEIILTKISNPPARKLTCLTSA
ncbi:hypothetical protein BMS3Abin13_01818 [bacterium BMS3Abin13]|nr:hypothetical protein BMS3Abin13_01818 [bacterium BMS3Abin13]